MIRINLLPFRAARKKDNIRRQIAVFVVVFILIIAGLFQYNRILSDKLDDLDFSIKQTEKQIVKFKKQADEVERIKKDIDLLKQKLNVINELDLNRKAPVHLMEVIARTTISKRMWLLNLTEHHDSLDLKGIALDNKTVADFMIRLEESRDLKGESKYFSSVNLMRLQQHKIRDMNLKSFDIKCKKPIVEKPEEDSGKKKRRKRKRG